MPSRAPAVRYTEARHSSMRTSLSSAGVSWRTLMGYPSYARNRACVLPSPSSFHCVMAKIVPVVQLAAHAKSSTLYGRSYGRTSKVFRLGGLLLFRITMGLRCALRALRAPLKIRNCHIKQQQRNLLIGLMLDVWAKCTRVIIEFLVFLPHSIYPFLLDIWMYDRCS